MNHTNLLTSMLRLLGAVFAIVVVGEAFFQAWIHLRDLGHINHIAGVWLTLAQAVRDGVFYPPLEEDGCYGGTRYMPLYFLLIAGLERLTGDYLLAAKLASLLAMVGLLGAVFAAARRLTGRTLDAAILAGTILAFPEGRRALLSPHADALAIALAVGGLALLDGPRRGKGVLIAAAALFVLSWEAKFSSVAAVVAAVVSLARNERRSQRRWLTCFTMWFGIAGFAVLQLASDGRFLENFRAVGSGGLSLSTLSNGPQRLLLALAFSTRQAFVTPLVLAPAMLPLLRDARERRLSVWDWYFLSTLGTTLFIFTSPGTDLNHLLELEVAAVLVLAGQRFAQSAVSHAVIAAALFMGISHAVDQWRAEPRLDAISAATLKEALPRDGPILTEDATAAVLLGRRPVVMDPFAYRLLAERGIVDPDQLAARIEQHDFSVLVLIRDIDNPQESLAPDMHFGPRVTAAIRKSYRFDRMVGVYYLFRPRTVP